MSNFYIHLASDVNPYDSKNSIGNFTTHLAKRYNLEGDWEIALNEISFPFSFYNVTKDQKIYLKVLNEVTLDDDKIEPIFYTSEAVIPAGRYTDIQVLVNKINEQLKNFAANFWHVPELQLINIESGKIKMVTGYKNYDKSKNKVKLVHLQLPTELCQILGFDPEKLESVYKMETIAQKQNTFEFTDEKRIIVADDPYDLSNGLNDIFVYCNLVHPGPVGNTTAPLLRRIHIHGVHEMGEQYDPHFFSQYKDLLTNTFNNIEISLKDAYDTVIPFQFGRVNLTLHLRKKSL